jgi:hypothetical protein
VTDEIQKAVGAKASSIEYDSEISREDLWRTLQVVSEWIRVADAKAGACIAVDGVMLALFAARLRGSPDPSVLAGIVLFSATGLAALSALIAVWTVLPRARRLGAKSIVHYGTIAAFDSSTSYHAAAFKVMSDPNEFAKNLTQHIWTMSRAADHKYFLVNWGIRLLIGAVAAGAIALLLR